MARFEGDNYFLSACTSLRQRAQQMWRETEQLNFGFLLLAVICDPGENTLDLGQSLVNGVHPLNLFLTLFSNLYSIIKKKVAYFIPLWETVRYLKCWQPGRFRLSNVWLSQQKARSPLPHLIKDLVARKTSAKLSITSHKCLHQTKYISATSELQRVKIRQLKINQFPTHYAVLLN